MRRCSAIVYEDWVYFHKPRRQPRQRLIKFCLQTLSSVRIYASSAVHGHVGSPHLSAIGHYPWPARRARTMVPMASGRFPSVLASIARVQIKQTKSIATAASPIVSVISRQLEAAAEFLGASWRGVYGRESSCRHG